MTCFRDCLYLSIPLFATVSIVYRLQVYCVSYNVQRFSPNTVIIIIAGYVDVIIMINEIIVIVVSSLTASPFSLLILLGNKYFNLKLDLGILKTRTALSERLNGLSQLRDLNMEFPSCIYSWTIQYFPTQRIICRLYKSVNQSINQSIDRSIDRSSDAYGTSGRVQTK